MKAHYTNTTRPLSKIRSVVNELLADSKQQSDRRAYKLLDVVREIQGATIVGKLPSANILLNLTSLLEDQKIAYALIGGLAVNVHGQSRATEDIDVLVEEMPRGTADVAYMEKFGFYRSKSSTGTSMVIDARRGVGYVELLLAQDELSRWAIETAGNVTVLHIEVPMVSREGLVATKLRAMHNNPKRRVKDLPDIMSVLVRGKTRKTRAGLRTVLTEEEWDELMTLEGVRR